MPDRWTTGGILVLWAAVMIWLALREMGPFDSSPPRFQDVLAATTSDEQVHWRMRKNILNREGELSHSLLLGTLRSRVLYDPRTGQYTLEHEAELDAEELQKLVANLGKRSIVPPGARLLLDSRCEVNITGDLQRLRLKLRIDGMDWSILITGMPDRYGGLPLTIDFATPVFSHRWEHKLRHDGKGMLLSSLCPMDRMPGLRPGQSWRAPLINPLGAGSSDVLVRVVEEPLMLLWEDQNVPCLVVESARGGASIQIWVAHGGALDGMVLKQRVQWQEANKQVTQVEIDREPAAVPLPRRKAATTPVQVQ